MSELATQWLRQETEHRARKKKKGLTRLYCRGREEAEARIERLVVPVYGTVKAAEFTHGPGARRREPCVKCGWTTPPFRHLSKSSESTRP